MDLSKVKKVFISGIGGIGVSAVARFLIAKGIKVVGSDAVSSDLTEALKKAGAEIYYEQKAENVTFMSDLFIYSSSVPATNPERVKAKELGLIQKSYPEFLGEMSRDYKTIAVSGTKGKSTTSALIAGILIDAEKDPTVILGSKFSKLDDNFRLGASDLLVAEACEYRGHMLLVKAQTIVLTNIAEDHLDYYKDLNHIIQTFQQYVNSLRDADDCLVYNFDDVNIRQLTLQKCKKTSFGFIPGADIQAHNVRKLPGKQIFDVLYYDQSLGDFELSVPGDINIYNALASIAYAMTLDIPVGVIKKSLREYRGIWRRFEIVKDEKITVVSDYAHNPMSVAGALQAAREFFPDRRLVAIFQPHQHSRTKKLFDGFVKSLVAADAIVLPEIYEVSGREEQDADISSQALVDAIKAQAEDKPIYYASDLNEAVDIARPLIKDGDVVMVMGAGDIYKIVERI
ncbi:MAG: UDP-N-acetylmuramate--L-alanine ligase [Parcubacteria group bacterium]